MSEILDTSDIDSLLDSTLDDLADMPEFKPFAKGVHKCDIKWTTKKVNGKTAIMLGLKVKETVELADSSEVPPAAGDETEVMFQFIAKDGTANAMAQGQFKKLMASLRTGLGLPETTSNRDIMEKSNGAECLVVTGIRTDKKTDPMNHKHYTSVEELAPV